MGETRTTRQLLFSSAEDEEARPAGCDDGDVGERAELTQRAIELNKTYTNLT